jgi:hypothetical protein
MTLQQVLLDGQTLAPGEERRLLPGLDVSAYDRLHLHVSAGAHAVDKLHVRVLFGTPVGEVTLLADSTVWFEETVSEREFSHQAPPTSGATGFVLSVPVVAPMLFDVILTNRSAADKPTVYVALFGQEI